MVDRLKGMIISGVENFCSPEVENVLMARPGVAEGLVFGVPDPTWVETVKAVVVQELPRNATGRILKRQLREPYWRGND